MSADKVYSLVVSGKMETVVDAGRKFFLIVGHHDQRLVPAFAESLDDVFHPSAERHVETLKRLIEYQQFGILYEGTCQ